MSDDLGIRLGPEDDAFALELLPQCIGVHDHSVMNDADPFLRVEVGVRVLVGLAAVRRPARVGDADVVARVLFRMRSHESYRVRGTAFARVFGYCQLVRASLERGHARAVVASVLEY